VRSLPLLVTGTVLCGAPPLLGCDAGKDDTSPDSDADTDVDTDADADVGDLLGRLAVLESYRQDHGTHEGLTPSWGPTDVPWEDGVLGDWVYGCGAKTGDTGVWRITRSADGCDLAVLEPCTGDCKPPCDDGSYCTEAAGCVEAPRFADSGTLTLGGLAVAVSLEPEGNGYPDSWGLPADLFGPGDPITLDAEGGEHPAFTAGTTGVEDLDATLPCEDVPSSKQAFSLQWTPPDAAGVRIRWEMTQDVHLSQGPRIRCEATDGGSLTVPAELMDAYVHGKKHGLTLTRYTVDVVEIPGAGAFAFEVGSAVGCVVHEGHTPW